MGTELLKNDKYEIKCKEGNVDSVELVISFKSEKLSDKEINQLLKTIRKILYAFDRTDSVSSRFGSVNGRKTK